MRINKANKLTACKRKKKKNKMPRYGSDLQKNAYDLFENQEVDMKQWANCSFKIELDDKNMKYIAGKEEVKEMKEIKKTLEDMIK